MLYTLAANVILIVHGLFVLAVVFGGLLALKWPRAAYLHLPMAAWGVALSLAGWTCPLTPLENELRREAGAQGYTGGFIEHYITAFVYPQGLTHQHQIVLGVLLLVGNAAVYTRLWLRHKKSR